MLQKIKNISLKKENSHCNFYSARLQLKIFSRRILINKTISKFVYLEKLFIYKVITFGQIHENVINFERFSRIVVYFLSNPVYITVSELLIIMSFPFGYQ